jgi:hypothetical protein
MNVTETSAEGLKREFTITVIPVRVTEVDAHSPDDSLDLRPGRFDLGFAVRI